MAMFTHSWRVDLHKSIKTEQLQTVLATNNDYAHRIQAEVYSDGEPVYIRGAVVGTVQRADGTTVVVNGGHTGNYAYIDLPAAAYAVAGRVIIMVKVTYQNSTTVVLAVGATVSPSSTGEWIDPGNVVPDVADMVAQTQAAHEAATEAAQAAEFVPDLIASDFVSSQYYSPGQYVLHGGLLYKMTANHHGDWDDTHAVQVKVADELRNIRLDVDREAEEIRQDVNTAIDGVESSMSVLQANTETELAALSDAVAQAGISEAIKTALLNCFKQVAWINSNGIAYYNSLYNALYASQVRQVLRITASLTQEVTLYTESSIEDLREFLVVTAYYTDGSSELVGGYTLRGTLEVGACTITVYYGGATANVIITVVDEPTTDVVMTYPGGSLILANGAMVAPASGNNNTIRINTNAPYGDAVRVVCTASGTMPYVDHASGQETTYYPIRVPDRATQVTVEVTSADYYVRYIMVEYYSSVNKYYTQKTVSWAQRSVTDSLPSVEGVRFLCVAVKATADGETAFPAEPSSVVVTFREV